MRAPVGFGNGYFTLAAIQAYASFVDMLSKFSKKRDIKPQYPIYIYSSVSPPSKTLSSD